MNKIALLLFSLAFVALLSCNKDDLDNLTSENIVADNFSVSITNMKKLTDEKDYTYTCTKDTNVLNLGGTLSKGKFTVVIKDANSNTIYAKENASVTGDLKQLVAPAGMWSVHIGVEDASGSLVLTIEN